MSEDGILTKDEQDALLKGVDSGDVDTEVSESYAEGEVRVYDLASQERIVRGRMPTLEMVNERFARYFKVSLFEMFRCAPEITIGDVETIKFADYIQSFPTPTNLNRVKLKNFRGTSLFIFEQNLVFLLVDNYFGGAGRQQQQGEEREFTETELSIVQKILKISFTNLSKAWKPVLPMEFEYLNSETNPQFANIVSPTEIVVVTKFTIELEGGGGDLHIALPYPMLEPIKELLFTGIQSDRAETDESWTASLREEMKEAKLEISSVLAETQIFLRDLINIKPGDIIPVSLNETVVTKVEGIPIFNCQYGAHQGVNAIKIIEYVNGSTG